MEPSEIIQIGREAVYVLILVSAPVMATALVVGLIISLLQALTQVQEATLTFVPKTLAMALMLMLALPFMLQQLTNLTNRLQERIVNIE